MFYDFQAFFVLAAADMIVHKMHGYCFPHNKRTLRKQNGNQTIFSLSDANISIFQALNNIIEL